jgi:hypothetical protein
MSTPMPDDGTATPNFPDEPEPPDDDETALPDPTEVGEDG